MIVAIPPKFEAYAMDNIILKAKFFFERSPSFISKTTAMTDAAIGYIIMVVAVLLSHILMKPVERINPRMILFPLVPVSETIFNAILL